MEKECTIPNRYPVCNRCVHAKDALIATRKILDSLSPGTHSAEVHVGCIPVGHTPHVDMAVILEVSPPRNSPKKSDFSRPHSLCPGYVTRAREINPNAYPKRDISKLLEENPFSPEKILGF